MKMYLVVGYFIVPGTCKVQKYIGRVCAKDLISATESIAPVVSSQVGHSVTPRFCQSNLSFTVVG